MNKLRTILSQKIDLIRDEYDFVSARTNPYCIQHEETCFDLEIWQIKEIRQALIEADDDKFATDKDLTKIAKKYTC